MHYIKKFNNNTEKENYIKSNFVSPHLFLETQNKSLKTFPKYKRLDYISSTATGGQYIDLGCKLLENTDDIRIDIKFNIKGHGKTGVGQSTLIAAQPEVSPWPGFTMRISGFDATDIRNSVLFNTKWLCSEYWGTYTESSKTRYACLYMSPKNSAGNAVISGGSFTNLNNVYEYSILLDNIPNSQINNFSCYLFCALDGSNNPFRFCEADLYYLKITKGNTVIRNLIPVQEIKTGEVGLWDLEHQVFYPSQGDESFVAGLIYDHKILYLESTGNQYINLDYTVWNHGLSGDIVMQRLEDNSGEKAYIGRVNSGGFDLYTQGNGQIGLWVYGASTDLRSNNTSTVDKNIHHVIFDINNNGIIYLKVDNDEYSQSYSISENDEYNLQLFSHRGYYNATGRIYSCKLWYNNVMIYDLIPVKKNGIGYMFDKLTNTLFGESSNSGVPFILGPDI